MDKAGLCPLSVYVDCLYLSKLLGMCDLIMIAYCLLNTDAYTSEYDSDANNVMMANVRNVPANIDHDLLTCSQAMALPRRWTTR